MVFSQGGPSRFGELLSRRPQDAGLVERFLLRGNLHECRRCAGLLRHDRDHGHVHLLVVHESLRLGAYDCALLFAVFWRRLALATSPEFYELRFSGAPALTMRTWVALYPAFIAVVAWTGAGLLGMHKVTNPLLGWDKMETFTYVIPVILFYVLLSGYIGVVWGDFFQTLIIVSAALLLMAQVWMDFGGPAGLHDSLLEQIGPSAVSWIPPADHEMLGLLGILAWTVGTAIGYGGDAAPMAGAMEGQRILSCRSPREASKMYIWTQIVLFFMLATLTLPALGAIAKWPGLYHQEINKELAFGMLLREYMPHGLLGLAIAGILAAIMSTVSSNMNFGAQVFVNDVYARSLVKNASTKHYMFVGRMVAAVIVGLAIVVASGAENVINISVFMLGLSSAELTANWAQWWWWRFNGAARLAASFGGPMIFLLNKFVVFPWYFPSLTGETTYQVVFMSMLETLVLWVVVALATKPEPEEVLVAFYKRARPDGLVGADRTKSGPDHEIRRSIHRHGLAHCSDGRCCSRRCHGRLFRGLRRQMGSSGSRICDCHHPGFVLQDGIQSLPARPIGRSRRRWRISPASKFA